MSNRASLAVKWRAYVFVRAHSHSSNMAWLTVSKRRLAPGGNFDKWTRNSAHRAEIQGSPAL